MAYRDLNSPDPALDTGFYNVNRAVGKGAPNRRADVMLVQLLLKRYYAKIGAVVPEIRSPAGEMAVDGYYGPITARWIAQFQILQKSKFPAGIATDGVVDRAKAPWVGSISGTTYMILALNHRVRQL